MNSTPESSFRAGFVALAGRPNVVKSTLINRLLGQKIAAVTPRPQTTRKRQLCILSDEHAQIVFLDTPGIHLPRHKLGERMNAEARHALEESDLVLAMVDASEPPQEEDRLVARSIQETAPQIPSLLVLNKLDLVGEELLASRMEAHQQLFPVSEALAISATRGDNLESLKAAILSRLPEGDPFFPLDQITDSYERDLAADLIREAALLHLRDEVPHGIALRIDEFTERGTSGAYIAATLFVERDSQKGIVIGSGGQMLKRIGRHARREIEAMSGRKVFLKLRVKVRKNWRNDEKVLRQFGFKGRR